MRPQFIPEMKLRGEVPPIARRDCTLFISDVGLCLGVITKTEES